MKAVAQEAARLWNRRPPIKPLSLFKNREFTFFLLVLIIMGPLLAPGRIFTLDSPIALNFDFAEYFSWSTKGAESVYAATYNSAPIAAVLYAMDIAVPFQVVEKAWLVLLLFLCAVGASRLPYLDEVGRYYAGFFYLVNPFTYIRFVSGQWGILGAYALIPFAVTSFVYLMEEPSRKRVVTLVLILTVISHLQLHGLGLVLLVLGLLYAANAVAFRERFKRSLPSIFWSIGLFLLLNLFWIARFVMTSGEVTKNMPAGELGYFSAAPAINVLTLRGSWLSGAFVDVSDLVPVSWMLFLPLAVLAVYGSISMWEKPKLRWLVWGFGLAGIGGLFMAAAPDTRAFNSLFTWIWEELPIYRSFRDTHKFAALLALAYAYFGAFGIQTIWGKIEQNDLWPRWAPIATTGAFIALTAVYALPIFSLWGQVKPTDFPEDWKSVRVLLDDDPGDYTVLVLPWHMYMNFDWLHNRWKNLANPAPSFFSQSVISGDNIEVPPSYSNSSNPQSRYVEELLAQLATLENMGEHIASLDAKYVVLFKTADYKAYDSLWHQNDLELTFEGDNIALFRNLAFDATARRPAISDRSGNWDFVNAR